MFSDIYSLSELNARQKYCSNEENNTVLEIILKSINFQINRFNMMTISLKPKQSLRHKF